MATERLKGQDVTIIVVQNSVVQDTLNCVKNFNGELSFEVLTAKYLGEKTNRTDMIFNGAKFDFELDTYTQDWISFVQAAQAKAKRTAPNNVFNITGVFQYPNGDTPAMLFADASFGPMPINTADRGSYLKHKIQGASDDVNLQPS